MRLIATLALLLLASVHAADTPPQVTVSNIRRIFHNGEHKVAQGANKPDAGRGTYGISRLIVLLLRHEPRSALQPISGIT